MVDEALYELRDALEAGDIARAIAQFDAAEADLEAQETRERVLRTIARGVSARTAQSDQSNVTARQLVEATGEAQTKRIEFDFEFVAFAEGDMSADEFADEVSARACSPRILQHQLGSSETWPLQLIETLRVAGYKTD